MNADPAAPSSAAATAPADPADFAAARQMCRRSGKFYLAPVFLPRPKRQAAWAVYAFGLMVGQAMQVPSSSPAPTPPSANPAAPDPCGCGDDAQLRLNLLREKLEVMYSGRLELPLPEFRDESQHVLAAVTAAIARYQIPRELWLDLAEGFRQDAAVRRYATWTSLQRHLYGTGGVKAVMLACVLGIQNSQIRPQAELLGNAMRLTDILCDIPADWARGWVYLPLEDLARFGYAEGDLANGVVNDNFRRLMKFQVDRARGMYRQAAESFCWLGGDGSRLTAAALAEFHGGILTAIERQNYDIFARRPALSASAKLGRFVATSRLAKRRQDQPLPPV